MAEWYSTHIYSVIVSAVGRFSGLFSCSLAELCLYVLVLLTVGSLIHAVVEAGQKRKRGRCHAKVGFRTVFDVLYSNGVIRGKLRY